MSIDVVSGAILLALALLGWRSGALKQAIRVLAAIAIVVAAPLVAQMVREIVYGSAGVTLPLGEAFSLVIAGIFIYTSVSLAGWLAIRTMRAASRTLSMADRLGGALLGLLKGSILVYFLLFAALFVAPAMDTVDPDDVLRTRDGRATEFVKEHNILAPWHLPNIERVHLMIRVAEAARDTDRWDVIRDAGRASEVVGDPRVQEILEDEALVAAAEEGDYVSFLADDRVRALLNDPDFGDDLARVEWGPLLESFDAGEKGSS